jgi:asparagine synthase (glutamine-hydrolysing)
MGALVGVLSRREENTVPIVIAMLQELAHRGRQNQAIVTPTEAVSARSIVELPKYPSILSTVSIGANASSGKRLALLDAHGGKLVLAGGVFCESVALCLSRIVANDEDSPEETGKIIIRDVEGSYAFAFASDAQMLVGRDPLGTMPLYYGENESLCAVASERKALWKIRIHDACSFPPGNLANVNLSGFSFKPIWTIRPESLRRIKESAAVNHLRRSLGESIRRRLYDANKVGIAFSGGLDSSIIARIVQDSGASPQLISVSLEEHSGAFHAEKAAQALDIPITVGKYDVTDVENTLPKVLWLIEEPDTMKASVAIPLFWSAQVASKLGCDVMLAGQGADELFGGYRRYLALYKTKGPDEVAKVFQHDTRMSYDTNFQRDEPLCAYNSIELRLPFADTSFVRYALSLPVTMKIQSADDLLRKSILRQLAKSLSVPAFVADRPKKAIQYETGVDKALRSLARAKGLTLHEYIGQVFDSVYPYLEGRRIEHSNLLQPDISRA